MNEYFRGWRRTVGCVTLLIACMVTISWARSRIRDESAFVRLHKSAIFFHHENGRFLIWRDLMVSEGLPFGWEVGSMIDAGHASTKTKAKWMFNSHQVAGQHWILVVPLTLLSAYLILWKPRTHA